MWFQTCTDRKNIYVVRLVSICGSAIRLKFDNLLQIYKHFLFFSSPTPPQPPNVSVFFLFSQWLYSQFCIFWRFYRFNVSGSDYFTNIYGFCLSKGHAHSSIETLNIMFSIQKSRCTLNHYRALGRNTIIGQWSHCNSCYVSIFLCWASVLFSV